MSLIALLGGTAAVLFAFGRFNFLGWMGKKEHVHPQILPCGETTASQRGTIKFFLTVALLHLAQGIAGALISHCRADPSSFYGLDLSRFLPSNITRTWHLQTALFWIATSYIAGAFFLAQPAWRVETTLLHHLLLDLHDLPGYNEEGCDPLTVPVGTDTNLVVT